VPRSRRLAAAALIALMAAGSILLWIGIPVGVIYLASRLVSSSTPSMGVYLALAIAIPALMLACVRALGRLDRAYGELTGTADARPARAAWLRSLRGERGSTRRRSVLDVVMVWSVGVALLAFAVWFFGFAGSSLPR
jgi:hypothetical protein